MEYKIDLQSKSVIRDSFGEESVTFESYAEVFASIVWLGSRERFQSNRVLAVRTLRFLIYFRSDIKESDRIVFGGDSYEIKGLKELERRRWLELTCEAVS